MAKLAVLLAAGAVLFTILPAATAQTEPAQAHVTISQFSAAPPTGPIALGKSGNITVSFTLTATNFVCSGAAADQNEIPVTITATESGSMAGITMAATTAVVPVSISAMPGPVPNFNSGAKTVLFSVAIAATAMPNHMHSWNFTATSGTPECANPAGVVKTDPAPTQATIKTGGGGSGTGTGTGSMSGSNSGEPMNTDTAASPGFEFALNFVAIAGLVVLARRRVA